MCMNLNFLVISGAVMNTPEKRVRPEDGMTISRFYLKMSENGPTILCKAYGQLAEKLEKIPAGAGVLCRGRLETTEIPKDGKKSYLTELVLSDVYPGSANAGVNIFLAVGRSVKGGDFYIGQGEKKSMWKSRMAVNRQVGESQKTEYINVKAFDKKAEFASKWLPKGTPFYANGVLSVSIYTDKEGVRQTSYELIARDVGFSSEKGAGGGSSNQTSDFTAGATGTDGAGGFSSGGFNTGWGDLPM